MFLGVDVGTGGTRAILVDREGRVVASESCEHLPIHSAEIGWAEQDPEDWWRAARTAITAIMRHAATAGLTVEAAGLTGQMHGCVMLDSTGQVLRPALIWCDQRTQPQCDWLHATIGYQRLIELTCNPALPNFTLTKLLWVREHQPEIFDRIAHRPQFRAFGVALLRRRPAHPFVGGVQLRLLRLDLGLQRPHLIVQAADLLDNRGAHTHLLQTCAHHIGLFSKQTYIQHNLSSD